MAEWLDGRYLLHERLGAGAFGSVHRAELRVLGRTLRQVAVKLFGPGAPAAELLEEAGQLMSAVERCPDPLVRDCFVTCYDAGVERGGAARPYVVMELAGGDLAARLHGGQLPVATVRAYARRLSQGIAFLHEQGVVHLDLKPSNILLAPSGSLKVADFGMAAQVSELLRRAPGAGGTLVYQPPEALQLRAAGPEADVYALGLICYEMLTGRLPSHEQLHAAAGGPAGNPDTDTVIRIKLQDPEPPGRRNPELRGDPLEAVVLRAISPLATDRYPDAGALLDALDQETAAARSPERRIAELVEAMAAALERGHLRSAADLSRQALDANRAVPDAAMVADAYLLATRVTLRQGAVEEARALATEGLGRRRCPATFQAMAEAFEGTDLGRGFGRRVRQEAG
ncbi:serine/threonine protein kinase [Spirillospora sp. NBC_00431]